MSQRLARDRPAERAENRGGEKTGSVDVPAADSPNVAWVNGQAVSRDRFEQLLHESQGVFVLEQLLAFEVIRQEAESAGIRLTQEDFEREYDRSVAEMTNPVVQGADPALQRDVGEKILEKFLTDRRVSRVEFMLSTRRNAYLRKLVEPAQEIADEDVQAEFEKQYGRKAVVRRLMLGTASQASEVQRRLESGEDFSTLAIRLSLDPDVGISGGLLPPFSQHDDRLGDMVRRTAFGLEPGQISATLQIEGQFHILKLERYLDAGDEVLDSEMTKRLKTRLQNQKLLQAMQDLEKRLLKSAEIRIADPNLEKQSQAR